jgi:hypothetical protein
MCNWVIFNWRSVSHYGHSERKREHPLSLFVNLIDQSIIEWSITYPIHLQINTQTSTATPTIEDISAAHDCGSSLSSSEEALIWTANHPVSAVDSHMGSFVLIYLPSTILPCGWMLTCESKRAVRAIAWLAHSSVPPFPLSPLSSTSHSHTHHLPPPQYGFGYHQVPLPLAATIIIIAVYKSFSIPSDMEEISNSKFRLSTMFFEENRNNNHPVHLVQSHDNNSPQRHTRGNSLMVHDTILVWMTHYNTVKFFDTIKHEMYDLYAKFLFGNNLQYLLSKTGSLVDESKDPNTIYVHNTTMSLL